MITVKLSDNTVLNNLGLDCNCFVADGELTATDFEGKLNRIEVTEDGITTEYTDCALYYCKYGSDGKTRFVIAPKTDKMKQEDRNTDMELALTELYEMIIGG